jgi:hypothetical protein
MDTLINFVEDIKVFIYGGVQSLPLVLGGTMLVLGLFTANYAMLFFLLGYLVLTPLVTGGINMFLNSRPNLTYFKVKSSDVCRIYSNNTFYAKDATETVVFSQWLAMISFFIGYVINNAVDLYTKENDMTNEIRIANTSIDVGAIDKKITNRKAHAVMSWVICLFVVLGAIYVRDYTGCEGDGIEKVWRIMGSIIIFGAAGYFWYNYLTSDVNSNRLSDLFGIANRLLPPIAIKNKPTICVPYSG